MLNVDWKNFERYLRVERKLDLSGNNYFYYKGAFDKIMLFFGGNGLNREMVNLFFENMEGLSNSRKNNYLKMLKHVARFTESNALEGFSYFKKVYKKQRVLTEEEVSRLLSVDLRYESSLKKYAKFKNQLYKTLFYMLAVTGMRIGEAQKLRWSDITPEAITVRAENAKTDKERQIPITAETYDLIHKLPKIGEYVFCFRANQGSGRLEKGKINADLRLRAKAAKLSDPIEIHCHSLRHFFATSKIKNGHAIDRVSKILGHADVGITAKTYVHYDMSMLRGVVEDAPKEKSSVLPPNTSLEERLIRLEEKMDQILRVVNAGSLKR